MKTNKHSSQKWFLHYKSVFTIFTFNPDIFLLKVFQGLPWKSLKILKIRGKENCNFLSSRFFRIDPWKSSKVEVRTRTKFSRQGCFEDYPWKSSNFKARVRLKISRFFEESSKSLENITQIALKWSKNRWKKYVFQGFLKKFQLRNSSIFKAYLEARIIVNFEVD